VARHQVAAATPFENLLIQFAPNQMPMGQMARIVRQVQQIQSQ